MSTINLEGKKRISTGKRASVLTRRAEMVPCVLYGGDEVINFESEYNSFRKLVYTDRFYKVELDIDGQKHEAVLKDIQFHPVTDKIIHVDFQELLSNKPVKADIPVKLEGFAAGVQEGGKLMLKIRKLELKGLPKDFPDDVTIDVTDLELGKSIRIRDIEIENCQILNSPSLPVASVVTPRALKGAPLPEELEAMEAAEAAEAAEGEEGKGEEGDSSEGDQN